jgi:hypothetical protein
MLLGFNHLWVTLPCHQSIPEFEKWIYWTSHCDF